MDRLKENLLSGLQYKIGVEATVKTTNHNYYKDQQVGSLRTLMSPSNRNINTAMLGYRVRAFMLVRLGSLAHDTSGVLSSTGKALFRLWKANVIPNVALQGRIPESGNTVEALARWPGSEEPNNSVILCHSILAILNSRFDQGFNIAHSTDTTMFDEIARHHDRDQRYADAMTYIANGIGLEHHHIVNGYDWASLGEGTVVDVGGSQGSLSIAIAQAFPSLRCIVQDRAEVIALGQEKLPSRVHGRVDFMAHDFFQEQPVKDADIYILRWILHDWSDLYASRIIQRLIPALRLGAKLLILEQILPGPGEISKYQEKVYRSLDLTMWATHNAKERDLSDWKELLRATDPGCKLMSVTKPQGSRLSILEIAWASGK
ncbi:MAG: hypothetical protein Q9195_002999 [Heterodermia aff. obscurata]